VENCYRIGAPSKNVCRKCSGGSVENTWSAIDLRFGRRTRSTWSYAPIDAALSLLDEKATEAEIELKRATARDIRSQASEQKAELATS
jgi:hypothetical protein